MGFREHLEDVLKGVDGALVASLMGVDGIEIDTHVAAEAGELDVKSLLVEWSGLYRTARDAAGVHEAGDLAEVAIHTGKLSTVARMVSPDYFLAVALRPEGNLGKARFLLRITAPKVSAEL